jgi:hypothetical protein
MHQYIKALLSKYQWDALTGAARPALATTADKKNRRNPVEIIRPRTTLCRRGMMSSAETG